MKMNLSGSLLKSYSKLTMKKYRLLERKFLVEGMLLVEEALRSDWETEAVIINSNGFIREVGRLKGWEAGDGVPVYECPESDFKKLSDTVASQGIVAVMKMKEFSLSGLWSRLPDRSIFVALDEIADPGNAGTILRTCDWFGVEGVMVSSDSVDIFNSKVLRATMGAVFHLPILTDLDLGSVVPECKSRRFKVITTILGAGERLGRFKFPDRSMIVFGNEARGVSENIRSVSDHSVTIPRYGKAESLNVGVSCGIILNAAKSPAG